MNSKLVIFALTILSILTISVSGQKLKTIEQLILQDDKSGDHLIFVISTGEYKFESCNGNFATGGVGIVNVTGCKVVLQDLSENRRVLGEIDLCLKAGKAVLAFEDDPLTSQNDGKAVEFILSDSNTGDSVFACESKSIDPK
jgi:hypothetical protein